MTPSMILTYDVNKEISLYICMCYYYKNIDIL